MSLRDEIDRNRLFLLQEYGGISLGDEAAWAPAHDQHHGDADRQHAVLGRIKSVRHDGLEESHLAEHLEGTDHHDSGDNDTDLRSKTPKHYDGEDDGRFHEDEGLGRYEALPGGEEGPGESAEHRAHGEGRE